MWETVIFITDVTTFKCDLCETKAWINMNPFTVKSVKCWAKLFLFINIYNALKGPEVFLLIPNSQTAVRNSFYRRESLDLHSPKYIKRCQHMVAFNTLAGWSYSGRRGRETGGSIIIQHIPAPFKTYITIYLSSYTFLSLSLLQHLLSSGIRKYA